MSKTATKEVEYVSDGQTIKATVDKKTAAAIGQYKSVYNAIQSFDITLCNDMPSKYQNAGFKREVIVAQSRRLKIVCIKDFAPNVPESVIAPYYECGIMNIKTKDYEAVNGIVPMLYYKLLRGRAK